MRARALISVISIILAITSLFGFGFFFVYKFLEALFPSMTFDHFFYASVTALNLPSELLIRYWGRLSARKPDASLRRYAMTVMSLFFMLLVGTILLVAVFELLPHCFPWTRNLLIALAGLSFAVSALLGVLRLQREMAVPSKRS